MVAPSGNPVTFVCQQLLLRDRPPCSGLSPQCGTGDLQRCHEHESGRTLLSFGKRFLCIGLNYFLIPLFGIEGAAIATFIAMFVYNVIKFFFLM